MFQMHGANFCFVNLTHYIFQMIWFTGLDSTSACLLYLVCPQQFQLCYFCFLPILHASIFVVIVVFSDSSPIYVHFISVLVDFYIITNIYIVLCIHTYIWLHIVTYIYTEILYGIVADSLLFPCFFHPFCFIFSPIFFHTTSLPSSVWGFLIASVPFPLLANLISLCFLPWSIVLLIFAVTTPIS